MGFSIWIYVFGFSRCNGLIIPRQNWPKTKNGMNETIIWKLIISQQNFISDHPVCKNIAVFKGTDFPKDKYNAKFHAEHKNITGEIVIVNHRVVFIDDSQNACIWWHETLDCGG